MWAGGQRGGFKKAGHHLRNLIEQGVEGLGGTQHGDRKGRSENIGGQRVGVEESKRLRRLERRDSMLDVGWGRRQGFRRLGRQRGWRVKIRRRQHWEDPGKKEN